MSERTFAQSARAGIEQAIYQGLLQLDARQFHLWLDATAPEFRYRIEAYSPEIRKPMTWLAHDRDGLRALIELLAKHHTDSAVWTRHAVVYTLAASDADTFSVVTSLAVYHTRVDVGDSHAQGGQSHLFAVGRYHDVVRLVGGAWLLSERIVRLDTLQLGIGSHFIV